MNKHHYWHAPTVPANTPGPTTVVIKSDCGLRQSMPVWMMRSWEAEAPATPPLSQTCSACLAVQIEALAETDLDAAATLHDRALAVGALTPTEYTRISGRVHRARRMREAAGR